MHDEVGDGDLAHVGAEQRRDLLVERGNRLAPAAPPVAAVPRSSAKMAADCVSPANSTPSALNAIGPIDLNAGPVAAAARSAAGTPDQDTSTVRTNADFRISDRIPVTPFPGPPRAVVSLNTEARVRRLPEPVTSPPGPKASKMTSDDVMARIFPDSSRARRRER